MAKLSIPLIKGRLTKLFLHNVRQFLENFSRIFEGISTGADLTKMVKICIILICAKKIFFGKIIYSTFSTIFGKLIFWRNIDRRASKEVFLQNFRQFSENWIFEGISTGADLIKMVKICIISICAKKIFFDKIICSTHQRKFLSTIFQRFLENWFFEGISTGAHLTKMVKFVLS